MDLRYWKQFESSGRVEDYLTFAAYSTQAQEIEARTGQVKEDGYGGTYSGDRDRFEGISGGRIR